MSVLTLAVLLFLVLESTNIVLLYFFPGSRRGNAVGVFRAWEGSKRDPEVHALLKYLVNWVAGTKLIFVALLAVLVLTAGPLTLWWSVLALVGSIASFFWRLFPAIRAMDGAGAIEPAGYSVTLGWMIAGFLLVLVLALILGFNGVPWTPG